MQMLFPNKALRDNRGPVLRHAREQRAAGDGRLIALSVGTEAVISATRPDSISDVSVSPLLMFSSPLLSCPLLSSGLVSSSLPHSNLCCAFLSSRPLVSLSCSISVYPHAHVHSLLSWCHQKEPKPTVNFLRGLPALPKPDWTSSVTQSCNGVQQND